MNAITTIIFSDNTTEVFEHDSVKRARENGEVIDL